jgi:hypothetical protein
MGISDFGVSHVIWFQFLSPCTKIFCSLFGIYIMRPSTLQWVAPKLRKSKHITINCNIVAITFGDEDNQINRKTSKFRQIDMII